MVHTERTIVYDSRRAEFRCPLGAIPVGGELQITVRPESHRFPLRGFLCTRFEPDGGYEEREMVQGGHSETYVEYSVTLPVGRTPGLWFYHFRFEIGRAHV